MSLHMHIIGNPPTSNTKDLSINTYLHKKSENHSIFAFCTPSGARSLDPNIKSVVLYQLS